MHREALDYGGMMQRALRGVLREALGFVAENGLPGEHHFYITIDTTHPGVVMPDWLRAQYPEEITIVIQHEFYDLAVTQDRFSVTLSFSNRSAPLAAPFDAVTTFVDPHAEFGLKFDAHDAAEGAADRSAEGARTGEAAGDGSDDDPGAPAPPAGGGDVVSLDRFRKG